MKLQEIITAVQAYHPSPDVDLIHRAYAFAREHHQGQTRASGEPFLTHVTEVAFLSTRLKVDVPSIATALLHDTVEDTGVSLEQIFEEFGTDVGTLVDGVTKLSQVKFSSRAEAQAENFRKMLLAMAKDIRVLLVKLCDRTHNMRTLEFLSQARRRRIAQETLEIYAPLAHRLGIYWMKSELEDLSLRFLKPEMYEYIKEKIQSSKKDRERYIERVVKNIDQELKRHKIKAEVSGRPKHFYSVCSKMERQGLTFDEIYDLIAFRLIVPSLMECYAALGIIHAAWKPIPGRFKDYIAMPKANNYQSLHTTVIGPEGHRVEIQIRTAEMHDVAEGGIAAHWHYKEAGHSGPTAMQDGQQFKWLRDLVESEKMVVDPLEFISNVKDDLFENEVYVFSPKGDLFALAAGSTPIDFAYHIHSEVGHHCAGSRVNGQQVPLSYVLRNGDVVEIVTSKTQKPAKDWLQLVSTSKAKQRVRGFLKQEERERSIAVGRELLSKDLRKVKLNFNKLLKNEALQKVAEGSHHRDVDSLLAEIGYGKVSTKQVVSKLLPDQSDSDIDAKLAKDESALQKIFQRAAKAFGDNAGVKVNGLDDIVFRFAKCCEPLPGNEIIGYVSRGRGVIVHRRDCSQVMSSDPRRLIPVSWDDKVKAVRDIRLRVLSLDKIGILASMSQSISNAGANIVKAEVAAKPDGKAVNLFEIKVEDTKQLDRVTRALEKLDGVLRVERYSRSHQKM